MVVRVADRRPTAPLDRAACTGASTVAAAPPPARARAALVRRAARAADRRAPPPLAARLHLRGGAGHVAAVADCVERIAAGEIFQANLCLRLEADWDGDVAELFAAAAPTLTPAYAACFVTPWGGIASLSPELFLRRAGRDRHDRPDQGHRAASPKRCSDSAKDRAEHVMIVDLMRNDLGRVAEYGSVAGAARARRCSRTRGVWHLVSDVTRRSPPSTATPTCCARRSRPARSPARPRSRRCTSSPQLESTGREVYTGAIGYASPHAGLELNVAIRTFEARAGRLWLGAGGGIVADSDPHAELEECLVKARPLIAAIGGSIAKIKVPGPFRFAAPLVKRAAGPRAGGVRDAARAGEPRQAPRAAAAHSVRELYGEELPEIEVPDVDGAVRIDYVPGRADHGHHAPDHAAPAADRADAVHAARRARRAQVARPRAARAARERAAARRRRHDPRSGVGERA